jgi:hypothetical protein
MSLAHKAMKFGKLQLTDSSDVSAERQFMTLKAEKKFEIFKRIS